MKTELKKTFKQLNEMLFENELKEVEFVINLGKKTIFSFKKPDLFEIGSLSIVSSERVILDDLVHTMIHLYHFQNNIEDYTSNQYHHRCFCEKALQVGFFVGLHSTRGWSLTTSDSNDLKEGSKFRKPDKFATEKLLVCYHKVVWGSMLEKFKFQLKSIIKARPRKDYQLKYVCNCAPQVIVRSGKRPDSCTPLNITCNECRSKFFLEK